MSGTVVNNTVRDSGVIAATAAGLNWNATAITASTVTVESGNGYWINTTSNTCTITLPSSATKGDQIVLIDYLRTWGTNKIIIDSNGLNYQGQTDAYDVEYNTDGQSLNIVYSDATQGWIPLDDDVSAYEPTPPPTQKGIFGFGANGPAGTFFSATNLVSSSGVVASDVTGVGSTRTNLAAAGYADKGIFGFGELQTPSGAGVTAITNLVSNSGVVATDTAGVGTVRYQTAATSYGTDKAIFGYGHAGGTTAITNLVSNSGVVATDTTGVGTARTHIAAVGYGSTGQAMFGYGNTLGPAVKQSLTNLVSNTGVVSADVTGVGTARSGLAACSYGGDKAIFGFGIDGTAKTAVTNLVSNTGVVATDVSGVGTARLLLAATSYGGDKGIFGFGHTAGPSVSLTNLVSNSGVVASDTTGVGSAREILAASSYSFSA